jgi:hypothetical protein
MKKIAVAVLALLALRCYAQKLLTPFEKSKEQRTTTYRECIRFYERLAAAGRVGLDSFGMTDAGYPLHVATYPPFAARDPKALTIFIINGIHPGEPDGIDASMMLLRDLAEGRLKMPESVRLAVVPVYNIGGALNRNSSTRVNQVGPPAYGFRGNSEYLDLNRDFTKRDALESRTFSYLFYRYDPAIFIDNHVSDGADYRHVMTLLSTQYDKLGGALGSYFRNRLDPLLYRRMAAAGWPMIPYVNVEEETPDKGWTAFYDPPRFSSGYAALFNCIAWVPETHMLKPFAQRVQATYALMKSIIALAGEERDSILSLREKDRAAVQAQTVFPLRWEPDGRVTMWPLKGYAAAYKPSEVTGQPRLYYDHSKPIDIEVPIQDYFRPTQSVRAPKAYIIPRGWHEVVARLAASNHLDMYELQADTAMLVTAYTIDSFKTLSSPYEGHYKHSAIHVTPKQVKMRFLKGDYLIDLEGHSFRRFIIEMLEPEGEDSYFAWGFFDAVLQRKEGYSDYRWEDVAADVLRKNPALKAALEKKKASDSAFAKDAAAQLFYVYQHSRWMEPGYKRYPVYRIE